MRMVANIILEYEALIGEHPEKDKLKAEKRFLEDYVLGIGSNAKVKKLTVKKR